jgi:tRNA-2-methylthio-N6-dimethylallyladenosine synthase
VPEIEKDRRLQEIQALLRDQQVAFNRSRLGMRIAVLFTGPGRHPGQVAGRSPWLQPVHAEGGADLAGRILPCEIIATHPNSLAARILDVRVGEARSGDPPSQEKAAA